LPCRMGLVKSYAVRTMVSWGLILGIHAETIDWERLFKEFDRFEPDEEIRELDASRFVRSLVNPVPDFVTCFIQRKHNANLSRDESVKALYSFLLEKRYGERLNLLHFAFHIFDEYTQLPEEIVDRTPFPHEDGIPRFTHINDPDFEIEIW
jgi:hypothetical protein